MSAQLTVELDEQTKIDFEKLCDDIGLSAETAVNIFAKRMVRTRAFPFEVYLPETTDEWQERNKAHLLEAIKQMDEGKTVKVRFDEFGSLVQVDE
ncbi:hypothetical protein FACS1894188_06910 [Clostridia bacterium]|nr:hypothetical protein FACS1894188_06910 [Clostridia bacterium]